MAFALLGLLGCKAETFGEGDGPDLFTEPVVIIPARQWSGGEVTLASAGLARFDETRSTFRVGDHEILGQRIAQDSIRIRLPADIAGGTWSVHAKIDGTEVDAGHVTVVGFSSHTTFSAAPCSDPTPWPSSRPRGVLYAACAAYQPPMFVSTEGAINVYTGLTGSGYSPSVSYRPDAIVDRVGRIAQLGRYGTGWDSLGSGPMFSRHGYELGPGVWLTTSNHEGYLSNQGTGLGGYLQLESEWLLVRSPAGPRATFVVSAANPGVPILDTENGTVVARMSGLAHTDAVAFSLDGTMLYAEAGQDWCCENHLNKIDATTGGVLQVDSTRPGGYGLAVDPGTPEWLYEVDSDSVNLILRIRSTTTLEVVGELKTPFPARYFSTYPGLVIDAGRRRGFIFLVDYPASHILQFDLLVPSD